MARSSSFTVGIIQEAVDNDVEKNVARAEARIREAAEQGAQIVCLQELFNALYFCKSQKHERFDLAESIPGPTIERMRKLARELEMVIIVPIFERQAAGVYRNSAAVIDADGSLLGAYRKMHIPDDPLFNEKFYFTPGDSHIADDGDHKGASGFRVWKQRLSSRISRPRKSLSRGSEVSYVSLVASYRCDVRHGRIGLCKTRGARVHRADSRRWQNFPRYLRK